MTKQINSLVEKFAENLSEKHAIHHSFINGNDRNRVYELLDVKMISFAFPGQGLFVLNLDKKIISHYENEEKDTFIGDKVDVIVNEMRRLSKKIELTTIF